MFYDDVNTNEKKQTSLPASQVHRMGSNSWLVFQMSFVMNAWMVGAGTLIYKERYRH